MKISNNTSGSRTRYLPTCRAVPQPIGPLRGRQNVVSSNADWSISDGSTAASKYNFTGMPKHEVTLKVRNTKVEILFVVFFLKKENGSMVLI